MKSGAPSSAPAMCIYEKDIILVYAKKRSFFKGETVVLPDCKFLLRKSEAFSKGETVVLPDCKFLCEKAKLFQKVKL